MQGHDYWSYFAEETRRMKAPLYARISESIGQDEELREFAGTVRPGQPPANVLFAAVHFLLLRGAAHPLRAFYPNLNGGQAPDLDAAFPVFKDFVARYREQLAPLVATRVTNTNEVGRSGLLHAGFRELAREAGAPLHLVEIGPSAGLNLLWDRYRISYRRDGESFDTELADAPLTIEMALRGAGIPPLGPPPRVATRVGLERNPVDLSDPDQRDWLKALVWPEQAARFARLEKAIAVFERNRPEIRSGDALELLPDALAAAPANETLCVYHTAVIYQFTSAMREALDNLLIAAGLRRPVWRLSFEFAGGHDHPLTLTQYREGTKITRTLALADPHGSWIEWAGADGKAKSA